MSAFINNSVLACPLQRLWLVAPDLNRSGYICNDPSSRSAKEQKLLRFEMLQSKPGTEVWLQECIVYPPYILYNRLSPWNRSSQLENAHYAMVRLCPPYGARRKLDMVLDYLELRHGEDLGYAEKSFRLVLHMCREELGSHGIDV
jgi:hypothetical protein